MDTGFARKTYRAEEWPGAGQKLPPVCPWLRHHVVCVTRQVGGSCFIFRFNDQGREEPATMVCHHFARQKGHPYFHHRQGATAREHHAQRGSALSYGPPRGTLSKRPALSSDRTALGPTRGRPHDQNPPRREMRGDAPNTASFKIAQCSHLNIRSRTIDGHPPPADDAFAAGGWSRLLHDENAWWLCWFSPKSATQNPDDEQGRKPDQHHVNINAIVLNCGIQKLKHRILHVEWTHNHIASFN